MATCGRCGCSIADYSGGYCSRCKAANEQRYREESKRWHNEQEQLKRERAEFNMRRASGASTYSGPLPLWAKIVTGVLVLGIAFFFAYRAGLVDQAMSGIAGLFGNEAASANAGVEAIRKTDWSDFSDVPESLSDNETAADQAAITAFMQNGESYRMSGSIKYGYLSNDTGFQEFWMEMEVSYNSELDVYKFVFSDIIMNDDERLNQYFGSFREGTYYVVNEDGNTYVLSDIGGDKTITDVNESQSLYNTLMGLRPESVIGFDFFGEESFRAYRLNGGTAYKADDLGEYSINYNPIEIVLKTYGDMPVYHYFCREDRDLGLQRQFEYNFYYDRIPDDNPTVADWN